MILCCSRGHTLDTQLGEFRQLVPGSECPMLVTYKDDNGWSIRCRSILRTKEDHESNPLSVPHRRWTSDKRVRKSFTLDADIQAILSEARDIDPSLQNDSAAMDRLAELGLEAMRESAEKSEEGD